MNFKKGMTKMKKVKPTIKSTIKTIFLIIFANIVLSGAAADPVKARVVGKSGDPYGKAIISLHILDEREDEEVRTARNIPDFVNADALTPEEKATWPLLYSNAEWIAFLERRRYTANDNAELDYSAPPRFKDTYAKIYDLLEEGSEIVIDDDGVLVQDGKLSFFSITGIYSIDGKNILTAAGGADDDGNILDNNMVRLFSHAADQYVLKHYKTR
ncbi:MAG: hypothetical protein LBI17_03105 [Rickettsiales bacterium]|jgi:hypothetical protein|nr:hypothetical protein [Rickettsiales bacterium]